jgi:predicted RNase H-like HicB family nuclease
MRITKEQLRQIIKEELEIVLEENISPPEDLVAWLKTQQADLEIEMDDKGNWVVYYDSFDNVNTDNLPPGWSSEVHALGGSDEDSSYIITRD